MTLKQAIDTLEMHVDFGSRICAEAWRIIRATLPEVAAGGQAGINPAQLAANGPRSSRSCLPQAVTPTANTSLDAICPTDCGRIMLSKRLDAGYPCIGCKGN